MAEPNKGAPKPEDNVDESGWTSIEPEGAGKHPHVQENYPDPESKQRWENDLGDEAGGEAGSEEEFYARGPLPAEGDGDGAPL